MTAPAFPPVLARVGWKSAAAELHRRSEQVSFRADEALGLPGSEALDVAGLRLRAERCAGQLLIVPPAEAPALGLLVDELLGLADELSEHVLVRRFRQLAECERGLLRLRERTTTADLIDGVCDELIRSVGLKRTMLARVEGGTWRPWKANAGMLEEDWLADWIDRSIPLDELTLETRLLSERRPELVLDTNVEGIAQMVRAAGVSSYVVAPIMPDGRVVGFLHADHGIDGRACDAVDRDLLWAFAEGFGHCYEQVLLVEELQLRREQVRRAVADVSAGLDAITDHEVELTGHPEGRAGARPQVAASAVHARVARLTERELDVLELVVAGARNGEIAERLMITVGTVKSHVKSVLSKLGVENRSQAIALALGAREQGVRPLSPSR